MSDTATVPIGTDPRTLISDELAGLIAADVRAQFSDLTPEAADSGVGQMVAYLHACAVSERPLSPSPLVDDFWHKFLLRTAAYQEYCLARFGKMVHHQPGFLPQSEGGGKELRARTVDAIAELGFLLDMDFWPEIELADSSQCHQNCHDSPFRSTGQPKG